MNLPARPLQWRLKAEGEAEKMNRISLRSSRESESIILVREGTLHLGRSRDNDLVIDDRTVSNRHAQIVTYFGASYIEDLGSTNGTFVNGRKVQMHTLHPGDVVHLGNYSFVVQLGRPEGHRTAA